VASLREIQELRKQRSEESFFMLKAAVSTAVSVHLENHEQVKDASELMKRYLRALDIVTMLEQNNMANQTLQELREDVSVMEEFSDVIRVASGLMADVKSYISVIENEMELVYNPMLEAFKRAAIKYDGALGMIRPKSMTLHTQEPTLQTVIDETVVSNLRSKNVKSLYASCVHFLKLRDELVPAGNPNVVTSYMESIKDATDDGTLAFQLREFHIWADIEMSASALKRALRVGEIPNSALGMEQPTQVSTLQELIQTLADIPNPSPKVLSVIRAGRLILSVSNSQ
jgi:hypothetical protein